MFSPSSFAGRLVRRIAVRGTAHVMVPVALATVALVAAGAGMLHRAPPATAVVTIDTVVIYGPHRLDAPPADPNSARPIVYEFPDSFGVQPAPTHRYVLRITNGEPDGSSRVVNGTVDGVRVDERTAVKTIELAVRPNQVLVASLVGQPQPGHLTVEVLEITSGKFLVFGMERFSRGNGPAVTFSRPFTVGSNAGAPYYVWVVNGNADGTRRLAGVTISLNGSPVVGGRAPCPAGSECGGQELTTGTAVLMQAVAPVQGRNQISVTLPKQPAGFVEVGVTATDITPPTLTVSAPAPGLITRDTTVLVTGTVSDASGVGVTVNGVTAARSGATYSANVPLAEGSNHLTISAIDANGARVDSTRAVMRDRQAPTLALTSPADGFVTSQATIPVAGTASDRTAVTVNVNGVPLPVDGSGAFRGSAPLSEGANVLTVTAADAAGNTNSFVRSGTRRGQPQLPSLTTMMTGITHTLLTSGFNATNQSVYTTASISPAANALITVAVLGRRSTGAQTPTISGGGMSTWTLIASVDYDPISGPLSRVSVFRALSSSPGSGALTITFASSQSNATWIVSQWSGVDVTGSDGAGAIVQSATANGDAVTSLSTTLNAFGNSNNVAYGVVGVGMNGPGVTPGSGFTEIDEQTSGESNLLQAEWGTNLTAVSASWGSAKNAGLVGMEIKASGGSSTITQTLLTSGTDTTNQTVYTTASITPAANALITVAVLGRRAYGAIPPSVTGGGMTTWTLVAGVDYETTNSPLSRISVFRAMSSAPGSGPLTISFSGNQSNATWIVSQWSGVDVSGVNGAGAMVQIGSARGDAVSSLSKTLSALANANDVAFGVVGASLNGPAITQGTGLSEIAEPTSGENTSLEAEWGVNLTTVSASFSAANSAGLLAFEIKAGGGVSGGVFATQSTVSASPTSVAVGSGNSTITVTAKDASGNPVSGATVVLSATGGGNTLTQPSGSTNTSGVATGTLSSTVAETKTVSATANGIAISQTATVTFTAASGSITHTLLTSGTNTTNQAVYTTASIAPAANALITVAVLGRRSTGAQTPTISGGGMSTWTLVASVDYDPISGPLSRVSVFRALSSAPGSGALTITFPNSQSNATWIVSQWNGADVTGANGAGAIVQTATANGDAVTSVSATLGAFGGSTNVAYGVVGVGMNGPAVTPGSGLTEIDEQTSGESNLLEAEWAVNQTAVSASWGSAKNAGLVAIEIKASGGGGQPPLQPPPVDPTVATTLGKATEFLYTGLNPVQTGVTPGAIDPVRVAVLRGRVITRDTLALAGATVSVLGHPEFGSTMSRLDGWYDFAVNGGQRLTLSFGKAGFLTGQRPTEPSVQDFTMVEAVALIPSDTAVTTVDFSDPVKVARGSVVTDNVGTRQATMLFKQGTAATMTLADGSVQPLTTLKVRATEYTVGSGGAAAMPGELPTNSAYTYAVELSVDEAQAVGATNVQFSQAVPVYVDNFIGFAVGTGVPAGYYDQQKGQWVPSANGRVIKVLSVSGGVANLDITGDDVADDSTALAAIGINPAERQSLATLYASGKTLWRVPVTHFSPWDFNWPFGFPGDAIFPLLNALFNPPSCNSQTSGSVIECESQALGEELGLAGTPFTLSYRSNRLSGGAAARTIRIALTGASIPTSLKRVEREVYVGGRVFKNSYTPSASLVTSFTWDGLDPYNRVVQGVMPVRVRIRYVYDGVYQTPSGFAEQFAQFADMNVTTLRASREIVAWRQYDTQIGTWNAPSFGLGGWTLSVLHSYDPVGRVLFMGDGTLRDAQNQNGSITTFAGTGTGGFSGDGGAATAAQLDGPTGLAFGSDGSLYIGDFHNKRIRRVSPTGIITTVAGNGNAGASGDGGSATQAAIGEPDLLDVAPDGSIIFGAWQIARVRKVDAAGIITTVAGTGTTGFSGDGGLATAAAISATPRAVRFTPDGGFYFVDGDNQRIRRVSSTGLIRTIAGTGTAGFSGDGGAASGAKLNLPEALAQGPDGFLYVEDGHNYRVRRISVEGSITSVLGTGESGLSGDGGAATSAKISLAARGIDFGPDGSLYLADLNNHVIRRVGPNGVVTTVAGRGVSGYSGDNGPAIQAQLSSPTSVAVGPDGSLYIADAANDRVRRVSPLLPGFAANEIAIASTDGSELYQFDQYGRHLRTRDALTGTVLLTFGYDAAGRIVTVTDADNNVTTVERDAQGNPTGILGPFGQRTTLTLDAAGNLASAADPAGNVVRLYNRSTGILDSLKDARGYVHRFTYDSLGRLRRDDDPAGGYKTLTLAETDTSWTVPITTALGRTTTYRIDGTSVGGTRRVITDPAGFVSASVSDAASRNTVRLPTGDSIWTASRPDPRWGMQAPIPDSATFKTPAGLKATVKARSQATLSNPSDPLSLVSETDSVSLNGQWTVSTYTASTRRLVTTSPVGRQSFATLDAKGRIIEAQVAGLDSTRFTYDNQGRLSQEQVGGRIWTYGYDTRGRLLTTLDPLGLRDSLFYDDADRLIRRVLPDSRVLAFGYDSSGNIKSITPAGRTAHTFTYTPVDLGGSYTPPNVGLTTPGTSYQYNTDRQLTQITRPDSLTVVFGYESATGRPSTVTFDRGTLNYGYSATTGNLESITAPGNNSLSFTYDGALPKTVTWSGSVAGSVGVTYNNDFRVTSQTVNGANNVSFGYDNDGLLTSSGALGLKRTALNGLPERDSVGSVLGVWSFDLKGDIASYTASASGSSLFQTTYTRDSLSRITQLVETIQGTTTTRAFTYDSAGRLATVTENSVLVRSYGYDLNGNRLSLTGPSLSVSGTYDAQDRLLSYGSTTYGYTSNGELKLKVIGTDSTRYTYDALGNLVQVILQGGPTIDYVIDGQSRRVGKKVNGVLQRGWLWQSQLAPVAELDGSGALVSRFVYAGRINVPDYMVKGGVTYRLILDHLGSVRLVVNTANGTVAQRIDYDEFGRVTQNTNPGFQPFGFAGGLYDEQTGLVRFVARDYDAVTGRWTAKEPLGFAGGFGNLFTYAGNNPQSYIDPTGLGPWDLARGFVQGAAVSLVVGAGSAVLLAAVPAAAPFLMAAGALGLAMTAFEAYHLYASCATGAQWDEFLGRLLGGVIGGGLGYGAASRAFAAGRATTGFVSNATVISRGKVLGRGTVDVRGTIEGIRSGRLAPRDIFQNRGEPLPARGPNYYEEFVHPTPGVKGVGPQRIIKGQGGELWYTPDHYGTFLPLN